MSTDQKIFVREGDGWTERAHAVGLAEKLSRELRTIVVDWSISTTVDQIWIVAYRDGAIVRELRYATPSRATRASRSRASWRRAGTWAKRKLYDRQLARAQKLGLNLAMLVEDTSPPESAATLPAFVHDPAAVLPIDPTHYDELVEHHLALSDTMLSELERLHVMFDLEKWDMLNRTYDYARPQLVVTNP